MGFRSVRLFQFRNVDDQEVDIDQPRVFLVGENGQGKSNFLESLYLLSYGSSFRTHRDTEMVQTGKDEMAVTGSFAADKVVERVSVRYQNGKKSISLNDAPILDRREMVSRIPCVLFQHDDMKYVSGPPELQRFFLDQTLSMFHPLHIDDLRRYRKILHHRNHALKTNSLDVLEVLDEQIAQEAVTVHANRKRAVESFNDVFADLFKEISLLPDLLLLEYRPSSQRDDAFSVSTGAFVDALRTRRSQELTFGTTVLGPHRDRIHYRYQNANFLEVASTGQQRLTSLILRVAQARLFAQKTNRRPVLLLDDVLLELDSERRQRFVSALPESEQTFFTFLPGELFRSYRHDASLVYFVDSGRFTTA